MASSGIDYAVEKEDEQVMLKLEGITKTTTLMGFRAYRQYDLERMFNLGLEEV